MKFFLCVFIGNGDELAIDTAAFVGGAGDLEGEPVFDGVEDNLGLLHVVGCNTLQIHGQARISITGIFVRMFLSRCLADRHGAELLQVAGVRSGVSGSGDTLWEHRDGVQERWTSG